MASRQFPPSVCPKCKGSRLEASGADCLLCHGLGECSAFKAAAWEAAQGHTTDPELRLDLDGEDDPK